ncbi:MAG TPA: hypothetical protein VK158_06705 [Acidobacteriota bacterium]|nr:hypothetical protein [Acidobacteriota bacterium]
MKNSLNKVGSWAFIIGVIIAAGLGLLAMVVDITWLLAILVIAGLIVGFLNVSGSETHRYLIASAVLVIVASLGAASMSTIPVIGGYLAGTLQTLLLFVVPAAVVVSLKEIYVISRDN